MLQMKVMELLVGDMIKYAISVKNTGNLTSTNLTFTDTMTDGNGGSLSLTIDPAFESTTNGSAPGTLKIERFNLECLLTYSAAAQTGKVINSIIAVADPLGPSGLVSDTSDDGDDSDGNTENDDNS